MNDLQYFSELKKELLRQFCEACPTWPGGLKDFGVREIAQFQNVLQEKTGGRVSEKWFYTHLKKDHDKLPRVDVLDLLSQFVGHENWGVFKSSLVHSSAVRQPATGRQNRWKTIALVATGALAFFALIALFPSVTFGTLKKYEVCFVDAMTQKTIEVEKVQIERLVENESPQVFLVGAKVPHVFELEQDKITFVVQAEYYRADTITRILHQRKQKEKITLRRDDYAWMIHLFSSGKMGDWKKRKEQLGKMVADDAMIFQVAAENGRPMELFNKPEFITKLTLPVGSLGELEILKTEYDASGKIRSMRFCQKDK